jgi:hypothetical protein
MDPMLEADDGSEVTLSLLFKMEEESPPEGEDPIIYEAYRVLPAGTTPMACLVEVEGDDTALMVLPVELLRAFVDALDDPSFV